MALWVRRMNEARPAGAGAPAAEQHTVPLAEPGFARGAAPVAARHRKQPAWDAATPIQVALIRRRRRRPWWLVPLLALVVVAGGITAVALWPSANTSPAGAVRTYFRALADGDTAAALAMVDNVSPAADPLLSAAVLARPSDRPTDVAVAGSEPTTEGDTPGTRVSVTYSLDGSPVLQTITVVGAAPAYRLISPFITVRMAGGTGRTLSVNTVAVGAAFTKSLALPGAYTAAAQGTLLLAPATARAAYTSSDGAVTATIPPPVPVLAAGAPAAVQQAVNTALATCAASRSATPPHCPFHYNDSSATVRWKITANPTTALSITGDAVTFTDQHAGTVHYDAATSTFFGLIHQTDSGDAALHVHGSAATSGSDVTITFG